MNEIQLLILIAEGNEQAFSRFYALFRSKVYNTCLSYLQNIEESEEAVQDIFLEIYASAGNFRKDASVSTWVYRLTVNKCLDRIRYKKRRKRFAFILSLFNQVTGELQFDHADFSHPGILLENKEKAAILFKAIDQLPENQKTAFILKHIEGLSQKEISEVMNAGEKAVESLIQRAKSNLRRMLSDIYDLTEGKKKK
jgi:RNA polymerase sigma factor (sigma-70 family)